jgi:indolepyruvate ferredoxin oxidoreductase
MAALEVMGVRLAGLADAGIRVLKLGMTFPLVPEPVIDLASSVDEVLVVEEKRPFIEQQVRALLHEAAISTPVRGKRDGAGVPLVPVSGELTPERIAPILRRFLPDLPEPVRSGASGGLLPFVEVPGRLPAFCSGCPHNRSTVVPVGSITGGGVGCHGMIHFEPRHAHETFIPPTPMGAEGAHWIGLAPFVGGRHLFQNLGDGTFSHSGSLAVRACVASGVHITFKLLFNSAVAMTGGQEVTGLMDVPAVTRALAAEGVAAIAVCTDDVERYGRGALLAPGVTVHPREDVVQVQEDLRRRSGVSVLIYDQRCAAEARRMRKRGELADPPTRVVINEAVCEGCGDCSTVSNCLSVLPVETEFGVRRQIHQSSCNKDYSCIEGDCPSFVTLTPKARPAASPSDLRPSLPESTLPEPDVEALDRRFSVYVTGIGGTGIVTANRLVAHAAVAAGYVVRGVDQTGLSQKAGAVVSHLHIAPTLQDITSATVADGGADLYLSGDLLQAASAIHLGKAVPGRTVGVIDSHLMPSVGMLQQGAAVDGVRLVATVASALGAERTAVVDASGLAERIFGSHLPANVIMLGVAYQLGALPVPADAICRAIRDESPAADVNLEAFEWGRWLAADPDAVEQSLARSRPRRAMSAWEPSPAARAAGRRVMDAASLPPGLTEATRVLLDRRAAQLVDYQGPALARRWAALVTRAAAADDGPGHELALAVAEGWFKLLSYKDEYEVARLHLRMDNDAVAEELGFGSGYSVRYHLHPPTLRRLGLDHKLSVGAWMRGPFRVLAAMRRLRGTPLDVFGYERHRREERAVADEYRRQVEAALACLRPDTYQTAVELARTAMAIKGYDELKSATIARWRIEVASLGQRMASVPAS